MAGWLSLSLSEEATIEFQQKYVGKTICLNVKESALYDCRHPIKNRKIKIDDEFLIDAIDNLKLVHSYNGGKLYFWPDEVIIVIDPNDKTFVEVKKKYIGKKVKIIKNGTFGHHPTEDRRVMIGDVLDIVDAVQWSNKNISLVFAVDGKFGKNPHWGAPNTQSIGLKKVELVEPVKEFVMNTAQVDAIRSKYIGKKVKIVPYNGQSESDFTQMHPTEKRKIRFGDILEITNVFVGNTYIGILRIARIVLAYRIDNHYNDQFGWGHESISELFVEVLPEPKCISDSNKQKWHQEKKHNYIGQKVIVNSLTLCPWVHHPTEARTIKVGDILEVAYVRGAFAVIGYKVDPKFSCSTEFFGPDTQYLPASCFKILEEVDKNNAIRYQQIKEKTEQLKEEAKQLAKDWKNGPLRNPIVQSPSVVETFTQKLYKWLS